MSEKTARQTSITCMHVDFCRLKFQTWPYAYARRQLARRCSKPWSENDDLRASVVDGYIIKSSNYFAPDSATTRSNLRNDLSTHIRQPRQQQIDEILSWYLKQGRSKGQVCPKLLCSHHEWPSQIPPTGNATMTAAISFGHWDPSRTTQSWWFHVKCGLPRCKQQRSPKYARGTVWR